jgi:Fic family protein
VKDALPKHQRLSRFMHEDASRLPALIKAGLLNVQFETIHPFLDGSGRIGRLLVTPYLCAHGVLRTHEIFQSSPSLTANLLVERTGLSAPTVKAALADLQRLGVVEEVTGRRRGRVFAYRRYLAILSEGTAPLA